MKIKASRLTLLGLCLLLAPAAFGNPITGAELSSSAGIASDQVTTIAKAAGALLGVVVTLIGGALTAWRASHEEKFTSPLLFALVGAAIAAVCTLGVVNT